MIGKSIFNVKFTMFLLTAVLFAATLVLAGCSSSEKKEEPEVTESTEVQKAPADEGETGAATTPAEEKPVKRTGPPQVVIDACAGLGEGDDCTIKISQGDVEGTCKKVRSGDIACMPNPRPGSSYRERQSEGNWRRDGSVEGE